MGKPLCYCKPVILKQKYRKKLEVPGTLVGSIPSRLTAHDINNGTPSLMLLQTSRSLFFGQVYQRSPEIDSLSVMNDTGLSANS